MELNSTSGTTNYGAQNLFGTTPYGGNIGTILASNRVGNNNLKFEKALKSEIEAAFFNNWLTMSSSVFQDVRKDFIYGDLTTVGTAFLRILMQRLDIKGAELSCCD
jgi:outer membrane receptor for ferrienterochelin and colicin